MPPRAQYDQELNQLYQEIESLGHQVEQAVIDAVAAFTTANTIKAKRIVTDDDAIDRQHEAIEQHVFQIIARQQPVAGDLRRILAALEVASELERIGDYAKRIGKATLRNPTKPTTPVPLSIDEIGQLAVSMLSRGVTAFVARDVAELAAIESGDDQIDALEDQIRLEMLALMQREPSAAEWALDQTLVAHTLERVGDRVTNMAEQLVFAVSGERVDLNP